MSKINVSHEMLSKIQHHPDYQLLLKKRSAISTSFFVFTLVVYNAFIIFLGLAPQSAGQPLFSGSTLSLGIFLGILICLLAILLVIAYVIVSNKIFDPLIDNIMKDVL